MFDYLQKPDRIQIYINFVFNFIKKQTVFVNELKEIVVLCASCFSKEGGKMKWISSVPEIAKSGIGTLTKADSSSSTSHIVPQIPRVFSLTEKGCRYFRGSLKDAYIVFQQIQNHYVQDSWSFHSTYIE